MSDRTVVEEYVAGLNDTDARAQLIQALHKLILIRRGPKSAPVGAVLELVDSAVESAGFGVLVDKENP